MNIKYKESFEKGLKYQDYVTSVLYKKGIVLVGYSSEEYQIAEGENKMGMEIKFDDNYAKTGNLYIEYAERRLVDGDFIDGGILRDDNTWLYLIGDYKNMFIFSKKQLVGVYNSVLEGKYSKETKLVEIETSRGMLLLKGGGLIERLVIYKPLEIQLCK